MDTDRVRNARRAVCYLLCAVWAVVAPACSPPPPPPAPVHLRLAVTPTLWPLAEQLAEEHRRDRRHVQVQISELGAEAALQAVSARQVDLALLDRDLERAETLSPEDGRPWLQAWPVGVGALAVVVHPSNPVRNLTAAQLRQAFAGRERRWTRLGGADAAIQLVCREPGAASRLVFERRILQGDLLVGTALVMPNDQAVADHVARHPAAVGYLGLGWAVEGVLPNPQTLASGAYPLAHPLVAVTPRAVSDKARAFIASVRSHRGQEAVQAFCTPGGGRNWGTGGTEGTEGENARGPSVPSVPSVPLVP